MTTKYLLNNDRRIATKTTHQESDNHIVFCGGFKSNMEGSKAVALESICASRKISYTRFDYSGHGGSDGTFSDGNIDSWLSDTLCVIDSLQPTQNLILVGSSMGAWIATLAASKRASRLAALMTIAAAPDFTQRLLLPALNETQLNTLEQNQPVLMASEYDDGSPYPITSQLIHHSQQHCILGSTIEINTPVRMLHGVIDSDVPYELSIELMNSIQSTDIQLNLIKDGDHRLSSTQHLLILEQTVQQLLEQLAKA